jgi:hypothetical protein
MPTYTNPNTVSYQEAGVSIAPSETKTTPKTLTETVIELPAAVPGLGLELVTEATSGETGRIYWVDGAKIGLVELSGPFTGELALTGDVSGALGTPAADGTVVNVVRNTATQFYTALLAQQTVIASGAGTEDVYLHRDGTWVIILDGDVDIVVKNGASGDVIIPLPIGKVWQDSNNQRYQHLKLTFSGAGSCQVLEFQCDFNPLAFSTF